jgi:uncharacterized membrane protein
MRLPLLILHILGGTVGLLAGTFAMAVRKGGRLHRASGNVFTIAMVTLASSALCLAIMKSQRGNIVGSIVTFYMITTAWLAGRRRNIGRSDWAALLVGLGGAAAVITLGVQTLHHPDPNAPAGMSFFFGVVLLLAAAGDVRMLAGGGIAGRQRITRHLWRMCFGLFIATGSFFLVRPTTGLSRFPARLDLPDRPRSPAISLDDLLAVPRPLQQGLQSRATAHANARGLLEGLRRSPHSLGDVRALTVEAVTWNPDVLVR